MNVAMATRWWVKAQGDAVLIKSGQEVCRYARKSTADILERCTTAGWKTPKQDLAWVPASFSDVRVKCCCLEIRRQFVKLMVDGDMRFRYA